MNMIHSTVQYSNNNMPTRSMHHGAPRRAQLTRPVRPSGSCCCAGASHRAARGGGAPTRHSSTRCAVAAASRSWSLERCRRSHRARGCGAPTTRRCRSRRPPRRWQPGCTPPPPPTTLPPPPPPPGANPSNCRFDHMSSCRVGGETATGNFEEPAPETDAIVFVLSLF